MALFGQFAGGLLAALWLSDGSFMAVLWEFYGDFMAVLWRFYGARVGPSDRARLYLDGTFFGSAVRTALVFIGMSSFWTRQSEMGPNPARHGGHLDTLLQHSMARKRRQMRDPAPAISRSTPYKIKVKERKNTITNYLHTPGDA